jgi:hypothetical protein
VRSTWLLFAPRLLAIAGKAGKYMSMDSGPIAVSAPIKMSHPGRPIAASLERIIWKCL